MICVIYYTLVYFSFLYPYHFLDICPSNYFSFHYPCHNSIDMVSILCDFSNDELDDFHHRTPCHNHYTNMVSHLCLYIYSKMISHGCSQITSHTNIVCLIYILWEYHSKQNYTDVIINCISMIFLIYIPQETMIH